ncbi:hypothetical protein BH09SUM1_BH09SUM1_30190 [soil metagenome]
MRNTSIKMTLAFLAIASVSGAIACKKNYIHDVDPGKPGAVRALGPESQDVIAVADLMVRSIEDSKVLSDAPNPPVINMLPMSNNTRYAFNTEIFASKLKVELNKRAKGRYVFVSRDINPEIDAEREQKREGQLDYDPALRTKSKSGADYFLKGRADGLAAVSTKGQSDTILYTFKLTDTESGLDVWEDEFTTKKEGKDDVIYR